MKAKNFLKELAPIAGKKLGNTRGIHPNWYERVEIVIAAYGPAAVKDDFGLWCDEVQSNPPMYPISSYLDLVDSRLGRRAESECESQIVELDSRIAEVSAAAFNLTGRTPSNRQVKDLLAQFPEDTIKLALAEYIQGIEEREYAWALKTFFGDGGCAAIITARKIKEQERIDKTTREQREQEISDAQIAILKRESDAKLEEIRRQNALPKQTGEGMFG